MVPRGQHPMSIALLVPPVLWPREACGLLDGRAPVAPSPWLPRAIVRGYCGRLDKSQLPGVAW